LKMRRLYLLSVIVATVIYQQAFFQLNLIFA
jgi:hypothetical protein